MQFKIIIYIGICYLLFQICPSCEFSQAQNLPDTLIEQEISESIHQIYDELYFENYQKAFQALDTLAEFSQKHQKWINLLEINFEQTQLALYNDKLSKAIALNTTGFSLLDKYQYQIDDQERLNSIKFLLHYAKSYISYEFGDFETASQTNKQALNFIADKDSLYKSTTFYEIAKASVNLFRHEEAILAFKSSLLYLPQVDESYTVAFNFAYEQSLRLNNIGKVYLAQFNYTKDSSNLVKAHQYISEALGIIENHQDQLLKAGESDKKLYHILSTQYEDITKLNTKTGQYNKAHEYIAKSEELVSDALDSIFFAWTKGDIYLAEHKFSDAIQYFQQAYQVAEKRHHRTHTHLAISQQKIGQVYLTQKSYQEAIVHFQQAIQHLDSSFHPQKNLEQNPTLQNVFWNKDLLELLVYKAKAYHLWAIEDQQSQAKLEIAKKTYHLAIQLADQIKQGYNIKEYSELLAERFFGVYEQALDNLWALRALEANSDALEEEIFYVFEKSRGSVLLETNAKRQLQSRQLLPDSIQNQENILLGEIYHLKNKIYKESNPQQKNTLVNQLLQTESSLNKLLDQIKDNYPQYFAYKKNTAKTLSLDEVQNSLLPKNTLIIGYLTGKEHIYSLAIKQDDFAIRRIQYTPDYKSKLTTFVNLIKEDENVGTLENFKHYHSLAYDFYQQLLESFILSANQETIQKLVILPDGLLNYLPFEALHTKELTKDKLKQGDYLDLPYLLNDYAVRYGHSVTLLYNNHTEENTTKSAYSYLGFAPSYENDDFLGFGRSFKQEFPLSKRNTGTLVYNQDEVQNSSRLFRGKEFLENEATKTNFLKHVSKCQGILHLSMHGLVNDTLPDQSCLVFGQTSLSTKRGAKTKQSPENPLLYTYEIYNMKIPAELVILSACETGLGRLSKGEGVLSIGRAFKLAGTKNLVMSYWAVDDQSTSILMQLFLKNLSRGVDKDIALQQAKISYLKKEGKSHQLAPHFWAGFILQGDDLALQAGQNQSFFYYIMAILLAFLVSGFMVYRKSHQ